MWLHDLGGYISIVFTKSKNLKLPRNYLRPPETNYEVTETTRNQLILQIFLLQKLSCFLVAFVLIHPPIVFFGANLIVQLNIFQI